MTLEEIKKSDTLFLTPAQVAPILRTDPQLIRIVAKTNPSQLGFPVSVIKSRVKIPRVPFLRWIGENV